MFKALDKWLPGYVRSVLDRPPCVGGVKHLIFCVADHFEPLELLDHPVDAERAEYFPGREDRLHIVRDWAGKYPESVAPFRDSDGMPPRHTFFCTPNDYAPDWMGMLAAGLCRRGFGEVELHLHHRNDTAEGLAQKLCGFRDRLRKDHGLLGSWRPEGRRWEGGRGTGTEDRASLTGGVSAPGVSKLPSPASLSPPTFHLPPPAIPAFGFIHGNWALCNSRPDRDHCGVNDELSVLTRAGCYADFTFPSAPSPTQPRVVNQIYRAVDRAGGRGQDHGVRCEVSGVRRQASGGRGRGEERRTSNIERQASVQDRSPALTFDVGRSMLDVRLLSEDDLSYAICSSLMLVQGPLALDWARRKWGVLPRLDNGGVTHHNLPTPARIDLWVRQGIYVRGRPEWVFVKVYTHGCIPSSSRVFLGPAMRLAHQHLQSRYNDGSAWRLHYATAREMYNIVRAAEDGRVGEPGEFRDYEVAPPPVSGGE